MEVMGSNQQFALHWDNYVRHVTSAFDVLRSDEDLVDVTLSCEGKRIRAHKMLLSACSTYFKELFKENPCQHPVIIFRNVKLEDLSALVDFMYQGQVNVSQDQLPSFLATAEMLAVQGLSGDDGDKTASITADERNEVVPQSLPVADEQKVQVGSTTWQEEGLQAIVSSPAPYFPKDRQPDSPMLARKRRRRHSDKDVAANGPRHVSPSPPEDGDCDSDTVEIIDTELPGAVKQEAVDYCEENDVQGHRGYGDSKLEVRNMVKFGREHRLPITGQLLGHDLSEIYSNNSRDSSLLHPPDNMSQDLGQLLQKAGPSSVDNLSQDSLQGDRPLQDAVPINTVQINAAPINAAPINAASINTQYVVVDQERTLYRCESCTKSYRHRGSLTLHQKMHTGETQCPVCNMVMSRTYELRVHLRKRHNIVA